jgi:hypothetical protein
MTRKSRRIDVSQHSYTDAELKEARKSVDRVLAKSLGTAMPIPVEVQEEIKAAESKEPSNLDFGGLVRDSRDSSAGRRNLFSKKEPSQER